MDSLKKAAPILFLALALLLFFWPVWLLGYDCPPPGGDTWNQIFPVWSYVARNVRQGVFPLWHTDIVGGDPIIGEPQYGLLNPLNWPIFLLSPIPRWVVTLRVALPMFIGGVGLYLYLRRSPVWGLGKAGALTASVAYMLSDPFIVHLGHPQFNDALAWFPWALLAIDLAIEHPPWASLTSLPIAMMGLAGHAQATLYGAVALVIYGIWRLADSPTQERLRRLGILAAVGILALALITPMLLPAIKRYPFTERANREILPPHRPHGYQWPPEMLLDIISPWFHGRHPEELWVPWGRIDSGYVGAVALFLALPGLAFDWKNNRSLFLILLGGFGIIFALGYYGPVYPLLSRLDFIARLEKTGRIAFLLCFSLSVGAGLAIERLRLSSRFRYGMAIWLAIVAIGLWISAPSLGRLIPPDAHRHRSVAALRGAAGLGIALTPIVFLIGRDRLWASGVVLLLAAELIVSGAFVEATPPEPRPDHSEALAFLQSDPGWFRVDVDTETQGRWRAGELVSAGFAVPQTAGNPMELRDFNRLFWTIPRKDHPLYRTLGVKYIIVPKGQPPGGEGIWPVFVDDPLIDIHLHTGALPRTWLVYRTIPVQDLNAASSILFDPDFKPQEVAVVEGELAMSGEGTGSLEVFAYGPNRVELGVHTSAPALLVLSDVFYPGWWATVDGERVPIYRTDGVFRGVRVPAGDHHVRMQFRSRGLERGLGIAGSAATVIAASVGIRWYGKIKRK